MSIHVRGGEKVCGGRCLSNAAVQREAKNGLSSCHYLSRLVLKLTFKYLNDNAGVTFTPFSRFINSSRKNESNQSEKFKPVSKGGGGGERESASALKLKRLFI